MLRYDVDFYGRDLKNLYHDSVGDLDIADDYVSFQRNTMEIRYTDIDLNNAYLYITRGEYTYFGVVVAAEPSSNNTIKVTYKNFLSVFDEDTLFDTTLQLQDTTVDGIAGKTNSKSLEQMLKDQIDGQYTRCSDLLQRLRINVNADTSTRPWGFNLVTDTEGMHHCIVGLYSVLIVNAMKKYGVGIEIQPDFEDQIVNLTIVNRSKQSVFNIDGDLNNVEVKTLKYNNRPSGVNKLVVYDTSNYQTSISFYVFTDRTWGANPDEEGKTRISPVVLDIKGAMPDTTIENPVTAFLVAAVDVAHGVLSGLEWDNLIELEVSVNDPAIRPLSMQYGQPIALWYKGAKYTSILTGRNITTKGLTMLFGSERIKFTKRSIKK